MSILQFQNWKKYQKYVIPVKSYVQMKFEIPIILLLKIAQTSNLKHHE